jgi:Protein of unknown function (DUF2795)
MAFEVTEVQKHLKGADYPATGEQLAERAHENGAPDNLVEALRSISEEVDGPNGVMKRLKGELTGSRRDD